MREQRSVESTCVKQASGQIRCEGKGRMEEKE
jgi:hypothetical protein